MGLLVMLDSNAHGWAKQQLAAQPTNLPELASERLMNELLSGGAKILMPAPQYTELLAGCPLPAQVALAKATLAHPVFKHVDFTKEMGDLASDLTRPNWTKQRQAELKIEGAWSGRQVMKFDMLLLAAAILSKVDFIVSEDAMFHKHGHLVPVFGVHEALRHLGGAGPMTIVSDVGVEYRAGGVRLEVGG